MNEVQSSTDVAVINTNISYIQKDISEIKQSIKDLTNVYATQLALDEVKKDLKTLKDSSNLWRWLSPTLSSGLTAIVVFLLTFYLQHLR